MFLIGVTKGRKNIRRWNSFHVSKTNSLSYLLLEKLKRKARRWTMNGFHIRTKDIVDHKKCPLMYRSTEVIESVKTSLRGKMVLKMRKRLIFTWSFMKPVTEAITERGLHLLMVLSTIAVGGSQLTAKDGNFLIRARKSG